MWPKKKLGPELHTCHLTKTEVEQLTGRFFNVQAEQAQSSQTV